MGWLILIPSFGIPITSILLANRFYDSIKTVCGKIIYCIIFITLSIFLYKSVISQSVLFTLIAKLIGKVSIAWLQVLLGGIYIGFWTGLIVGPIIPIMNQIFSLITKSSIRNNKN